MIFFFWWNDYTAADCTGFYVSSSHIFLLFPSYKTLLGTFVYYCLCTLMISVELVLLSDIIVNLFCLNLLVSSGLLVYSTELNKPS